MKNPKVYLHQLELSENYYRRNQYTWTVSNLIQYCKEKDYPVFKLPLAGICLEPMPWDIKDSNDLAIHFQRCMKADLSYPIILDDLGYICDGWHRLIKAIATGETEIDAIQIEQMPRPDGEELTEK